VSGATAAGDPDVAVIGAGPAGLAAATAAAHRGASVTLIDEAPAPGGQIWRAERGTRLAAPVHERVAEAERLGVEFLAGTLAWAARRDRTLLLTRLPEAAPEEATGSARHAPESWAMRPRAIVLATGAHDRPFPFPGWTLPGVLTAGGLQALAKSHAVPPGSRVVLAGAGPFLLPVACSLLAAGAEVMAVAEATRRRAWLRAAPRLRHAPERLWQLARYEATLARAGVPRVFGHVVVRAEGGERITRAVLSSVDGHWRPLPTASRSFEVDFLGIGYGFQPNLELARLLGCRLAFADRERQFVVSRDRDMRTSVDGVFAAGEIGGIGGAELAESEGLIAGVSAASATGHPDNAPEATRRARRRARRLAAFSDLLADLFTPVSDAIGVMDGATEVCRCEGVTLGDLERALAEPSTAPTTRGVKSGTRIGMGPCQGSVCGQLVGRLIAARTGQPPDEAELPSARPPAKPIPLGILAGRSYRPEDEKCM
jgi:NADPH-dependent 2,4-dienoyl-CoA reductase/sulfur reductase-like enzyme